MQAKSTYRDRDETELAVLDALVDAREEGLTIFEVRASVDAPIDDIEDALAALKADDLIRVTNADSETRIYPHDRVIPDEAETDDPSLVDALREKLPF
ncbi:DUF6432 family protein [Halosegnis longus]|uniref:MarR family transcriptional regulator n=1 Tax=Halosegnis longus TaxID=2216012 RepID=A0AAJ4R7N3_9EURY|nr:MULTISPECIES: DUF6432 family protein [Halobacteriales]RNJ25646.1 MarR family transcriptional regulator [Salella cibi]